MTSDDSPQDWEKLWETFHKAREADPSERSAYLHSLELMDPVLVHKVKQLLSADEKSGTILEEVVAQEFQQLEESESQNLSPQDVLAGRFRILRELGKGGMGTVYEAQDDELGIKLALKMMRSDLALDPGARDRFHREINLARQITHPNACRIFDLFHHQDVLFLTMELLEGQTLHEKIRREGPLDSEAATSIVLQVSQALIAIHGSGIIHRDFKTSNILLVPQEKGFRAVITDFGLATTLPGKGGLHVTETGQVFGTPEFMAPEQLKKESLTPATDVYALGLVMYEMVTGKLPHEGESPLTIAAKRISEEAPTPRSIVPNLDHKWERVILRCLERNPKHRFQNASEVAAALKGELFTSRIAVFPMRHRTRLVSAGILILIAVLAGLFFLFQRADRHARSDVVARRLWTGATGLPAGVISTDGKLLIDIDWQTADVISIELSSGKKRRLTNSGFYFVPREYVSFPVTTALSNRGNKVAFSVQYAVGKWDLRIVNIKDLSARTIYSSKTDLLTPQSWSTDDTQILALRDTLDGNSQIIIISTESGSVHVLKSLDSAEVRKMSFSADGQYVVYDYRASAATSYDLFIVSIKTGEQMPLVSHPAHDNLLGWAPGRNQIVFVSDRAGTYDVWLLDVVDGKPQGNPVRTRKDVGQIFPLKLTRDGALYYSHLLTSADVYIADRSKKKATKLSQGVPGSNRFAQFSPDGKVLLFGTVTEPVATRWTFSPSSILKIVRMNQNQEIAVPHQIKLSGGITRWSRDGRFVVAHTNDGTTFPGLCKINVETGESTILWVSRGEKWVSQYDWSSDGAGLYYLLDSDRTIRYRNLETAQERPIYDGVTNFAVSSNGLWIAATSMNIKSGATDMSILPATGGKARKILTLHMPEFISELTWNPDGNEIVFARGRRDHIDDPHNLWSIPVAGGTSKDLGISTEYVQSLSHHPDGQRIAVSTSTDTSEVWVMENFLQQGIPAGQ